MPKDPPLYPSLNDGKDAQFEVSEYIAVPLMHLPMFSTWTEHDNPVEYPETLNLPAEDEAAGAAEVTGVAVTKVARAAMAVILSWKFCMIMNMVPSKCLLNSGDVEWLDNWIRLPYLCSPSILRCTQRKYGTGKQNKYPEPENTLHVHNASGSQSRYT